jgi:hypothetical protein
MRYVRIQGPDGVERGRIDGNELVTEGDKRIELLDAVTVALPDPYELLAPINAPEIWCAGVTYERSRDARVDESTVKDVYTLVYEAPRPELFLKDAAVAPSARASRSGFATTRPGTSPSPRSASCSERTARSRG